MKAFVALTILAVVGSALAVKYTEEDKQKAAQISKDCAKATNVNQEVIEKARKGEFAKDETFLKHLVCIAKKTGFLNEAGEVQHEVIKKHLYAKEQDQAKADKLIEKCVIVKATPEETAFESSKCFFEHAEKENRQYFF